MVGRPSLESSHCLMSLVASIPLHSWNGDPFSAALSYFLLVECFRQQFGRDMFKPHHIPSLYDVLSDPQLFFGFNMVQPFSPPFFASPYRDTVPGRRNVVRLTQKSRFHRARPRAVPITHDKESNSETSGEKRWNLGVKSTCLNVEWRNWLWFDIMLMVHV